MTAKHTINRTGTKAFRYTDSAGKPINDKESKQYFKSLAVPPAWEHVEIAVNRKAKILASGIDQKGRTQYIYHPSFRAKQEAAKFEKILKFAQALPRMREVVNKDLKRSELDYKKVMATIVSILDQTYIRIGNETYAKSNDSYGLTTLRSKHTDVSGDTITFDFIGKSGKHHVKKITDRSLARIVRQLDHLPGYEVFKYYQKAEGATKPVLRDVKSSDVNQYIKDVMGEDYSAKDFRTWAGTLLATAELSIAERASSERDRKKTVTGCVKKVAAKLGNTPAVARSSYIDPRIIERFMDGDDLSRVHDTVATMKHKKGAQYLSPEEMCVLKVLEA